MVTKEEAKKEISKLINDFKINYQKYAKEGEANTETKLVEPLFRALGWENGDFIKQERAYRGKKSGRADYVFYLGDRRVFFLEVKKVGIPLEKEADKQVISYALSKRIPFAVSTNFEQMKIFCVEQKDAINNRFRVFSSPEEYIDNIQDLFFLSKESFENNIILKKAESEGRLKKRISIDKTLLEDFMLIRKLISDDLERKYAKKYGINEKDEIVQRILDRLIFIRRCEDTGINPEDIRLEELKYLPQNKICPRLKAIFERYNEVYNSGLFKPNVDSDCDKIAIDGGIIQKFVYYLYESKDIELVYNFADIDADILGQVYEQYLGKILQQTRSGKANLKEGQAHRKEQGIYYTPTYIVDYIVKNTVEELLKNKKTKAENIKILDPACGSGSFLIKAFDYLYENLSKTDKSEQRKFDLQGIHSIKTEILKNNLFGVDLDNKAVEITKLNLLLKASEKDRKLPEEVDMHIRHGNSLIDDEGVAGLNAFKWVGDFKEGSFDVIIGNPPYIRNTDLQEIDKNFFDKYYFSAYKQYDILILFFEKGIRLLRKGGYLGFITSNKFMASDYGEKLRELILKNCKIVHLIDASNLRVFKDASTYPVIAIFKKVDDTKEREDNLVLFKKIENSNELFLNDNTIKIKQNKFNEGKDNRFVEDKGGIKYNIIKKIEKNSTMLKELFFCQRGSPKNKIQILSDKSKNSLNCIISRGVGKYITTQSKDSFVVSNLQDKVIASEKILMPRTVLDIKASLDEGGNFIMDRIYFLIPKEKNKINLKFVIGVLNSKLVDFYYKINFGSTHVGGGYLDLRGTQIVDLPLKLMSEPQQTQLIKLVDKMLSLNKELNKLGDKNTSETAKLKQQIDQTDYEINELVYELYGITKEEQEVIETS